LHYIFRLYSYFIYPQIKTFPIKRGPPSLRKDGNISDAAGGEKKVQQVVREEGDGGEEEDKEKKIVR